MDPFTIFGGNSHIVAVCITYAAVVVARVAIVAAIIARVAIVAVVL